MHLRPICLSHLVITIMIRFLKRSILMYLNMHSYIHVHICTYIHAWLKIHERMVTLHVLCPINIGRRLVHYYNCCLSWLSWNCFESPFLCNTMVTSCNCPSSWTKNRVKGTSSNILRIRIRPTRRTLISDKITIKLQNVFP